MSDPSIRNLMTSSFCVLKLMSSGKVPESGVFPQEGVDMAPVKTTFIDDDEYTNRGLVFYQRKQQAHRDEAGIVFIALSLSHKIELHAWDALLMGLGTCGAMDTPVLPCIIPWMFLARVEEVDLAKQWLPMFVRIYDALQPLVEGLWLCADNKATIISSRQNKALKAFRDLLGEDQVGSVVNSKGTAHFVSETIRKIDNAGAKIWLEPAKVKANSMILSLAAVHLWRQRSAAKNYMNGKVPQNITQLEKAWLDWQKNKADRGVYA